MTPYWLAPDVLVVPVDYATYCSRTAHCTPPTGAGEYPVTGLSIEDARAYVTWLSQVTGAPYRLPTDTEWTHTAVLAVRTGARSPRRRVTIGWYRDNSLGRTHPVAAKPGDAIGLKDFFGNAAEWASANDAFVTRGGSYRSPANTLGPATRAEQDDSWNERDPQLPKSRWWLSDGPFVGFRVVHPVK